MFGPVTRVFGTAVDIVAPGACSITKFEPISNSEFTLEGVNPAVDSDGSPLTGLTARVEVTVLAVAGIDPGDGLTPEEILALPGANVNIVKLDEATDAGAAFVSSAPVIGRNAMHVCYVFCADHDIQ